MPRHTRPLHLRPAAHLAPPRAQLVHLTRQPSLGAAQPQQRQQQLVKELFAALSTRSETASSLVDASHWFGIPGARVIYRLYATLYFCMWIDGSESELGILDLIQVLVEALDQQFTNVCELDIIFNAEKVHWVIDEMIVGGLVIETNPAKIHAVLLEQAKIMSQQTDLGTAAAAAQSKLDQLTGRLQSLPRPPGFPT